MRKRSIKPEVAFQSAAARTFLRTRLADNPQLSQRPCDGVLLLFCRAGGDFAAGAPWPPSRSKRMAIFAAAAVLVADGILARVPGLPLSDGCAGGLRRGGRLAGRGAHGLSGSLQNLPVRDARLCAGRQNTDGHVSGLVQVHLVQRQVASSPCSFLPASATNPHRSRPPSGSRPRLESGTARWKVRSSRSCNTGPGRRGRSCGPERSCGGWGR